MKRTVAASLFLVASTALGNAQIAVIDGANLDVARENAENTNSIMKSNGDILEKSKEILQALSGTRNGSLGIGQQGLGGGMSIASAPSFGSVLNGGTLSFGGLGGQAQQIAGAVINGLQLVKQLKAVMEGEDPGAVNSLYNGSVNTSALLAALTQQASQGVTTREQSLHSATGQIGQAENVKGSVDENTRMQLETARSINELIGVQNGAVSALNEDLKFRLTQQSQVQKMLQFKDVNPFKDAGGSQ
ncbi:MAG: conjugal transfer protein [Mesorhizobium sp.]|uniref:type IV secretion system protein n=1 Tax=Mesorhizobium sp. TaxID=1871066 RepID=UPI000FE56034|nr:type IV secretion system protein [Mesorhizobium sp.]RWI14940.1 MAG: conjugal transfer protein [Mesorhizobium sp.]RWK45624.1 MAG: conjugal transfer protein [Mesorhizobium sp.]RWK91236.1 MAG: conjugal transfer protein [Mesorhizobium sp.]RWM12926.1 MAG: conjugal transfer protein [Mesorhizobium sp.]TIQ13055.1 MAG: conjugal transfer protein [Mesorhizobium sp.]